MNGLRKNHFKAGVASLIRPLAVISLLAYAELGTASDPSASVPRLSETRVPLDLFKTWDFDQQSVGQAPAGFSSYTAGTAGVPSWAVQADPAAPSAPNVLRPSAPCPMDDCFQVTLVDMLEYDYLDLVVRIRFPDVPGAGKSAAGLIFGARDQNNGYAVTVDGSGQRLDVIRLEDGKATTLRHGEIMPKPIAWHVMRVRRNTIISKEYIEVFFDGVQVLSVEDKTFGAGRIGLITQGPATVDFDNLTAAPLYSQKPLSDPAPY